MLAKVFEKLGFIKAESLLIDDEVLLNSPEQAADAMEALSIINLELAAKNAQYQEAKKLLTCEHEPELNELKEQSDKISEALKNYYTEEVRKGKKKIVLPKGIISFRSTEAVVFTPGLSDAEIVKALQDNQLWHCINTKQTPDKTKLKGCRASWKHLDFIRLEQKESVSIETT